MKLEARALCKSFGEKQVLREVSLSAEGGKALGLLGRNGAGKTTSIRIIMGVFPADAGEVLLDGAPIRRKEVRIGYMPEERGLYPKQIVMDQMYYFGALQGQPRAQVKQRVTQMLERLGMPEAATVKLDTLSKGNQQKIQLVATLLNDPDIVVLDEPFSGLDPVNAMLLKDIVRDLIAQQKILLFSSHQMHYVEEFCDNIAILNAGRVVLSGSLAQIKRGYDRRRVLLRCAHPAEGAEALRAQPWVREAAMADGLLQVDLRTEEEKAELMRFLAQGAYDVEQFLVYEPSLNEIFVAHTEGGI